MAEGTGFVIIIFLLAAVAQDPKTFVSEAREAGKPVTTDYDVAVFYRMLTQRIPFVPTPPVAVRFY